MLHEQAFLHFLKHTKFFTIRSLTPTLPSSSNMVYLLFACFILTHTSHLTIIVTFSQATQFNIIICIKFSLCVYFNVCFLVFLLLLLVSYHCSQKKVLGMISVLLNLPRLVLLPNMTCPGKCSTYAREDCVFCCRLDEMFGICLLGLFGLKYSSSPVSVWIIYPLLKAGYWNLLLLLYCLSLPSDMLVFA